ncbi:MAG: polysaccharide pyruvyl transferase family protein [Bacteroides sp.]|nr:polysaccharide pyruvyl transferase family protein [Bacteroides sp.]
MKIGIATQSLLWNYGGVIQNYALHKVLIRFGHEPITIDYIGHKNLFGHIKSALKTLLLYPFPSKRRGALSFRNKRLNPIIDSFIRQYIKTTKQVDHYCPSLIDAYKLEALITGSDQVWRPCYNPYLKDLYLDFAKNKNVLRIAYAASFGTSEKEYTDQEINDCFSAAKMLSAVSVREGSGINLCWEYFNVEAQEVLDPTLLLTADDYQELTKDIQTAKGKYIGVYVLDKSPYISEIVSKISQEKKIPTVYRATENTPGMSPKKWISLFRDAEFIITDSFHGTIFSIIFQKPFLSICNMYRGGDRFISLLEPLGLMQRLISYNQQDIESRYSDDIDWQTVTDKLCEKRISSLKFIKSSLDKRRS